MERVQHLSVLVALFSALWLAYGINGQEEKLRQPTRHGQQDPYSGVAELYLRTAKAASRFDLMSRSTSSPLMQRCAMDGRRMERVTYVEGLHTPSGPAKAGCFTSVTCDIKSRRATPRHCALLQRVGKYEIMRHLASREARPAFVYSCRRWSPAARFSTAWTTARLYA